MKTYQEEDETKTYQEQAAEHQNMIEQALELIEASKALNTFNSKIISAATKDVLADRDSGISIKRAAIDVGPSYVDTLFPESGSTEHLDELIESVLIGKKIEERTAFKEAILDEYDSLKKGVSRSMESDSILEEALKLTRSARELLSPFIGRLLQFGTAIELTTNLLKVGREGPNPDNIKGIENGAIGLLSATNNMRKFKKPDNPEDIANRVEALIGKMYPDMGQKKEPMEDAKVETHTHIGQEKKARTR